MGAPKNHSKPWSTEEDRTLIECLNKGMSSAQAASALSRTISAVWNRKTSLKYGGKLNTDKRFANSKDSLVMPMIITLVFKIFLARNLKCP